MRLRLTRNAAHQLDAIIGHLAIQSPQGASNVAKRIRQITALLAEHPFIGRVTARARVRRIALVRYPYVIDYRVDEDTVVILGVRHTSRAPRP